MFWSTNIPFRDAKSCYSDRLLGLDSEQGIEFYYNIEITPWLHITPDVQVIIDPGGSDDNDTAIVCGLRMQMSF